MKFPSSCAEPSRISPEAPGASSVALISTTRFASKPGLPPSQAPMPTDAAASAAARAAAIDTRRLVQRRCVDAPTRTARVSVAGTSAGGPGTERRSASIRRSSRNSSSLTSSPTRSRRSGSSLTRAPRREEGTAAPARRAFASSPYRAARRDSSRSRSVKARSSRRARGRRVRAPVGARARNGHARRAR